MSQPPRGGQPGHYPRQLGQVRREEATGAADFIASAAAITIRP